MKHDDAALFESLLTEIVGALKPAPGALRNAEVALEILRRRRPELGDRSESVPADLIDDDRFTVRWNGDECDLGSTVLFRLFRRLARPANRYVSVGRLLEDVWGDDELSESAVRSAVRHLRRKLEHAGMTELAEAIRGQPGHYGLLLGGAAPRSSNDTEMPQR
jgi:DNA-binding response OmpR family regulator